MLGTVVEEEGKEAPEDGVVDPEDREPEPHRRPRPEAHEAFDREVAPDGPGERVDARARQVRVAGDGVELPREGRRLEEDEDDGEEDEECVREHHPEAVEDIPRELEGPGGAHVVENAGAVLRELDAERLEGPDERAEQALETLGVAREVAGEVVDRGADDDREPEQHADHDEDDDEEGEGARGAPATRARRWTGC